MLLSKASHVDILVAILTCVWAKTVSSVPASTKSMIDQDISDSGSPPSTTPVTRQDMMVLQVGDQQIIIPDCMETYNVSGEVCPICYDGVTLWYPSLPGKLISQPCPVFEEIPSLEMTAWNTTRYCHANGSWASKADYSQCISQVDSHHEIEEMKIEDNWIALYIYVCGFIISNIAMLIAMILLCKFKRLKCLRNAIHCQLFLALILKNCIYLALTVSTQYQLFGERQTILCKVCWTLYKFFHVSQYTWMFVEGLYLFLTVTKVFVCDSLSLRHCLLIGWGIPLLTAGAWVMTNHFHPDTTNTICWFSEDVEIHGETVIFAIIMSLLTVNIMFMVTVIYILVKQLNKFNMEMKRLRKTAKATIILVPLLGGVYLLLLYPGSKMNPSEWARAWSFINAVAQSTQGFTVAFCYCFMNSEVRGTLQKSIRRLKDQRSLPSTTDTWFSKRRRSSYACTSKREDTDSDYQNNTRRNSGRSTETTVLDSRRGSSVDNIDVNCNKLLKALPNATSCPLLEEHVIVQNTDMKTADV